jgi:glycosyltransferase involved in cell wall biosynthesis
LATRKGIGETLAYAPTLPVEDLVGLVRGARAVILPVVSEAAGLPIIEALACGTPVVASAVGPIPELVGPAGLLVEPGDADRLAIALATIWVDDGVRDGIAAIARERASADVRSWADVARETRAIYAEVGVRREP